jgi:hypothetical protein
MSDLGSWCGAIQPPHECQLPSPRVAPCMPSLARVPRFRRTCGSIRRNPGRLARALLGASQAGYSEVTCGREDWQRSPANRSANRPAGHTPNRPASRAPNRLASYSTGDATNHLPRSFTDCVPNRCPGDLPDRDIGRLDHRLRIRSWSCFPNHAADHPSNHPGNRPGPDSGHR